MDLEQLLRAASEGGQPDVWNELGKTLTVRLRKFFRGSGFTDPDIEDLVQITLFAVIRRLPGFQPRTSFRAWLFGIARNQGRRAIQRRDRLSKIKELLGHIGEIPETGPSTTLRRLDLFELAVQEIAELPEHYRVVIEHFLEDGDAGTLAEQTGLTRASARARKSRALALVREGVRARMKVAEQTPHTPST